MMRLPFPRRRPSDDPRTKGRTLPRPAADMKAPPPPLPPKPVRKDPPT